MHWNTNTSHNFKIYHFKNYLTFSFYFTHSLLCTGLSHKIIYKELYCEMAKTYKVVMNNFAMDCMSNNFTVGSCKNKMFKIV